MAWQRFFMKHTKKLLATTAFTCLFATQASASVIQISNASGSFDLQSYTMDLFNGTSPNFSTYDLAQAHTILNNWGITTDGKITILPVNTSQGLSFLTLIDMEFGGGDSGADASLGITSTASNALGMVINDVSQDSWQLIQPPFGSQTLGATFVWGGADSGDGFAWTDLAYGDAVSYSFTDLDGDGGAIDAEAFQFVGWDDIDGWGIVSTNGFKVDGTSVFTGMVIPAPPAAMLLTTLLLCPPRRRR
jgi:hypothetical protein